MIEKATTPIREDSATPVTLDYDDVASLAYQFWMDRGCPIGSPDEDWFRAEQELKSLFKPIAAAA